MENLTQGASRRTFRWPGTARELVGEYLRVTRSGKAEENESSRKTLIAQLAVVSGNPRSACLRFARQMGITSKRAYRPWTTAEQQRLLDLIASHTFEEVVVLLRRSPRSIRSMLHRLGASARMGQDWFTKSSLAAALHVRAEEVQKWIDRGWLKCRTVRANGLERAIIDAEDFCAFSKEHRREIVGNRLNPDRLNFVQTFVFPPSHAELLPVRNAKKEREAYKEQKEREGPDWFEDDKGERQGAIG